MNNTSLQSRIVIAAVAAGLLVLCALCHAGAGDDLQEYQVKAAFLFNFAKFVEWPDEAFTGPEAPVVIGIVGSDPFGENLDAVVQDKTIRGRRVEIKRFPGVPPQCCQVLFIGTSSRRAWPAVREGVKNCPVLTVSDMPGYLEKGGIIEFVNEGKKIRFAVNLEAASKARLQISSKMLNLAARAAGLQNPKP